MQFVDVSAVFLNQASLAAKSCAPKPPKTDPRLVTEVCRLRTTDLALFNRKLTDWLVFYNAERPHHSLSQQSPLSFLLQHQPECQRYYTLKGSFSLPCQSSVRPSR
jgi:hypothetical protein